MKIAYIIIVSVLLSVSLCFGQEVVDRILAVVDDGIILESEVLQFAQNLAMQNRSDPVKFMQDEKIKNEILRELIDQKVILANALEDTMIIVEDREIKRELDNRLTALINQVGSEEELEKLYGMPIREIRRDFEDTIREGLYIEKYRQKELSGVKITRSEVEDFYNEFKKELSDRPETIELAHILLQIAPSMDAEVNAKALIDSLYGLVSSGQDFEQLATDFSQDKGTAKKGGSLGWSKRGDFVPEFEEAAFQLEQDEISPPVKSRYGYHIIRLNGRKGEKINLSHILVKLTPTDDDRNRTIDLADSLYDALKDGVLFEDLARDFSQDEETSQDGGVIGTFTSNELIPVYAKAIKNLEPGGISKPLKTDLGMQILKVLSREKPRPFTLGEDWERIYQMALNKKRDDVYLGWVDKLKRDVYIELKSN